MTTTKMSKQTLLLYASNFLTGLVFWYGIEKLFMVHIGIDAIGIGIAIAVLAAFVLVFNIPAGIVADKWSRKGVLFVSAISLGIGSIILAMSNGLVMYIIGYLFFGVFAVSANGTYSAITYDSLREEGRENEYSRLVGRMYGLYLIGLTGATALGGFIASRFSFQASFLVSVIPCTINAILILTLHEPKLHKAEKKERIIGQIKNIIKIVISSNLLRTLAIILNALIVVEVFKNFGQLYMARYISAPQIIGILWGCYALSRSIGSFFAHRFRNKLNLLVMFSTLSLVAMVFIDSWIGIVLFMLQTIAFSALNNQIETRIQESTPSSVRASIMSVLSSVGKAISVPVSLVIGWAISQYNIFTVLQLIAVVAAITWLYWLFASISLKKNLAIDKA